MPTRLISDNAVDRLIKLACRRLKCDSARVINTGGQLFLVIGHKRNTKQDLKDHQTVWKDQDGRVRHFDYTQEATVASGSTITELAASTMLYRRLQRMSEHGQTLFDYALRLANGGSVWHRKAS